MHMSECRSSDVVKMRAGGYTCFYSMSTVVYSILIACAGTPTFLLWFRLDMRGEITWKYFMLPKPVHDLGG